VARAFRTGTCSTSPRRTTAPAAGTFAAGREYINEYSLPCLLAGALGWLHIGIVRRIEVR
jgi:hypothetical protein